AVVGEAAVDAQAQGARRPAQDHAPGAVVLHAVGRPAEVQAHVRPGSRPGPLLLVPGVDGVVDVALLDQVLDDALAVAALAVLAGQGEPRRLGGLAGVEVPADQPLRLRAARL